MATAVSSVETLCNKLQRSRLLKASQVRAAYGQWRKLQPARQTGEVDRFARWLVSGHFLTAYQAQQLVLGHADHFFLNHYQLLDLIGKGRMAGIFKAAHVSGHLVAVKIMPVSKSKDPQLMARFRREAKMAVRLKHDSIVRTYHLGVSGTRHYIVMEYLEGETLEEVLKRRQKLPFPEACRLVYRTLLGLQHIHQASMVHRDLKPGNLMLTPLRPPGAPDNTLHSSLKILDIGLGRVIVDDSVTEDSEQLRLTAEGMMLGTIDYMAPEQVRDAHNVDIRADIYSLGSVLYHTLTGWPPFNDSNQITQLVRIAQEPPKPIRALEPDMPAGLEKVVNIMLAKDPRQRFATPEQAAQALDLFISHDQPLLPPDRPLGQSYVQWVESQPLEEVNAAPAIADRWYYTHQGRRYGPVSSSQLDQLASAGNLSPEDRLWMEGDDPGLGIHARAAVDFSALRRQSAPPTEATAGFNPETGRIIDADKFRRWQKERRTPEVSAAGATLQDIFFRARTDLSNWVDLDKNRPLIMTGDMEAIRQDGGLKLFMQTQRRYGDEMVHKLWHHVEFMVENRRKYFFALGR
jgi:serine/threonine protein kinase